MCGLAGVEDRIIAQNAGQRAIAASAWTQRGLTAPGGTARDLSHDGVLRAQHQVTERVDSGPQACYRSKLLFSPRTPLS